MKMSGKSKKGQRQSITNGTHAARENPATKDRPPAVAVYWRFGGRGEAYIFSEGRRYTPDEWQRRITP